MRAHGTQTTDWWKMMECPRPAPGHKVQSSVWPSHRDGGPRGLLAYCTLETTRKFSTPQNTAVLDQD